ncbi:CoA-transferase family III [Coniochaeta ligniaria NRRL 30616]|uniref:CoA-transferase family III n=1 Tax=Coniochaeta ligniaria NRRL 30616 TaxID=1408157 RepID=A0A1J7IQM3_9PEZI|nr:CoA-transferase family III [Coniochaeta ligniaria NRRL 30616]
MVAPPPLTGLKVIEFAGLAPGPFAGLLLADAGASVLRIDRPVPGASHPPSGTTVTAPPTEDMLTRHKTSIAIDLKSPAGTALARRLAASADVLIDPFRPGVLERLGLGPETLCAANPRLVYARMTGFRRDGRYATMAGHDINYLAVSGVLSLLGRKGEKPTPPWNILGDFAGGGAMLFQGVLMALVARGVSGKGQVVEANMVDGASYLATFPRMALKTPLGERPRGENLLDTGCPWYDTYETRDGRFVAVGAIEPQFYRVLVEGLGLGGQGWEERRHDRASWPEMRGVFERVFRGKTREEWEGVFDGTDACCTPVYEYGEMEAEMERKEGDQRPAVTLRDTPCLAVRRGATDPSHGQGEGVEGGGYVGFPLAPGQGGEEVLKEWLGWERGREFDVLNGGLVLVGGESKL